MVLKYIHRHFLYSQFIVDWKVNQMTSIVWKVSFKTAQEQHKQIEIPDQTKGEEFETILYSDAEILRIHMNEGEKKQGAPQ